MNTEQILAMRKVIDAVLEAVAECEPQGAPSGLLYAALMGHGCTLQQFQSLTGGLVRAGKLRKSGDLFHVVAAAAVSA